MGSLQCSRLEVVGTEHMDHVAGLLAGNEPPVNGMSAIAAPSKAGSCGKTTRAPKAVGGSSPLSMGSAHPFSRMTRLVAPYRSPTFTLVPLHNSAEEEDDGVVAAP